MWCSPLTSICVVAVFFGLAGDFSVRCQLAAQDVTADAPNTSGVVVVGVPVARVARITARTHELRSHIQSVLSNLQECRPWVPPCIIHIHADRASFTRAVGGGPAGAEGATSIEFLGDVVRRRRIDVLDDHQSETPPALAHELVHMVLADHFSDRPPPRWADEGLATLFDSRSKQSGHETDFRRAAARGQSWRLVELMSLGDEPSNPERLRVFYGQSASLVRWLLGRADGPTFLRFLHAADDAGMNDALRTHYQFDTIDALERAWRQTPASLPPSDDRDFPSFIPQKYR